MGRPPAHTHECVAEAVIFSLEEDVEGAEAFFVVLDGVERFDGVVRRVVEDAADAVESAALDWHAATVEK